MTVPSTVQTAFTGEPSALMALWLSSGGAVEALAESDAAMARAARSGRHGTATDDGLQAGAATRLLCADDGMQAGRVTTNPFNCADDGLRAVSPTPDCGNRIDDDGLQCGNVTKGYGCIPPSIDDGLRAGNATGPACYGGPSRIPPSVDEGLRGGGAGTQGWSCNGTVDDGLWAGQSSGSIICNTGFTSPHCGPVDDGLRAYSSTPICPGFN